MKRLIFLSIFAIASLFSYAQEAKPLEYSEIVPVEGATKDELYNRAKVFFVDAFKDAKEVIQLDDKDGGMIVAKGVMTNKSLWSEDNIVDFRISIALKDGRYKYDINNFTLKIITSRPTFNFGAITDQEVPSIMQPVDYVGFGKKKQIENYVQCKKYVISRCQSLIESLKSTMQTPVGTGDDNW